jgi:hypothetical protein
MYAAPGTTEPMVGTQFYNNSALTQTFPGNNVWYKVLKNGNLWAAYIDGNGVVQDYTTCGAIPSQTATPPNTPCATPTPCPTGYNINWTWGQYNSTENNGGLFHIYVNGHNMVYEYDTTGGSFNCIVSVNVEDTVEIFVNTYANTAAGTQTCLTVDMPLFNQIYQQCDTQTNPGSPSSQYYSYVVSGNSVVDALSTSS